MCCSKSGMRQRMIHRLELENDLRKALENQVAPGSTAQELQVYYQPIVSLATWKITGFEALVRWKHPRRGLIPPKEFIPVAEETGLIHLLGLWVMRQACQQMRQWQIQYPHDPPLTIHVNVSGKQFGQPDFVDQIQHLLGETGLEPRYLNLEITESLFVENDERFNDMLRRLCSLGVELQIDDFGTGYSSFSYLQRLPVSTIKINSTFIANMKTGNNHAEIVRSIVTLARSLGMSAIAEGVEIARPDDSIAGAGLRLRAGLLYLPARARRSRSGDPQAEPGDREARLQVLIFEVIIKKSVGVWFANRFHLIYRY